jgi:anti-sigma factor RsiW
MTRWISCREFVEFLWRYLEGDVSDEERKEFEFHLAGCPTCVAYMDNYRRAGAMGKQAFADPEASLPGDVPDELVAGILAARKKRMY